MKIAVVGAGAVGLTTACLLREHELMRNAEITVFADDFDDCVSNVAAGIFRVGTSYSGPTEEITRKWIKDSYEYYDNIRRTNEAALAGVTDISGYIFANSSADVVKNHWLEAVVPIYRRATEEELQLTNGGWKYGSFFSTLLTQCTLYLPWIRQRLQINGVTFRKRYLNSFNELLGDFDIIMNCTGLGARKLCNDKRLVAIRGQVHKVKAPWIKMFFYGELDTYVIPSFNGVVTLGGSRSFDCESTEPCPYEYAAIRERCTKLIPSLANAEFDRQEVGLRPHRECGVRVGDGSNIISGGAKAIIVHNYGHGGYGVCTAPGTAIEAVNTAVCLYKRSNINSKL